MLVGADLGNPRIYFVKDPIAKGLSYYLSVHALLPESVQENAYVVPLALRMNCLGILPL